jgi:hypothetical protein
MELRLSELEQLTMRPERRMQYGDVQEISGRSSEAVKQ